MSTTTLRGRNKRNGARWERDDRSLAGQGPTASVTQYFLEKNIADTKSKVVVWVMIERDIGQRWMRGFAGLDASKPLAENQASLRRRQAKDVRMAGTDRGAEYDFSKATCILQKAAYFVMNPSSPETNRYSIPRPQLSSCTTFTVFPCRMLIAQQTLPAG